LFLPARWKAYLQNIQDIAREEAATGVADDRNKGIYHFFHSQTLWFTREEDNGYHKAAEEHLKRCDALLEDCASIIDALEETLANTPKPSEVVDWSRLW